MIKNIVFDLGNVLLTFSPGDILEQYIDDPRTRQRVYENIFRGQEWEQLDRGVISKKTACSRMIERRPEDEQIIDKIMENWEQYLNPIPETIAILRELHERDYPLYVLSNFHQSAFELVVDQYDFFDYFTGIIISARVKAIKPEPEIYRVLLDRFVLNPEQTLFIDDSPENLEGARRFGMKTIHFQGSRSLRLGLKKQLKDGEDIKK